MGGANFCIRGIPSREMHLIQTEKGHLHRRCRVQAVPTKVIKDSSTHHTHRSEQHLIITRDKDGDAQEDES